MYGKLCSSRKPPGRPLLCGLGECGTDVRNTTHMRFTSLWIPTRNGRSINNSEHVTIIHSNICTSHGAMCVCVCVYVWVWEIMMGLCNKVPSRIPCFAYTCICLHIWGPRSCTSRAGLVLSWVLNPRTHKQCEIHVKQVCQLGICCTHFHMSCTQFDSRLCAYSYV